jgi:soluble P-type ATPase
MAKRRMFSLDVIDTDLFMEMPQSSRLLYYELCMRADDDGFVSNPKKILKMVGCSEDDFRVLTTKQFIIPFDTGIVVIKHWKIHNYIQKDRYKETIYLEEKQQINEEKNGMYTKCIQVGYTGKDSIELGNSKVSIDKISIGEGSINKSSENKFSKDEDEYDDPFKDMNFDNTNNDY